MKYGKIRKICILAVICAAACRLHAVSGTAVKPTVPEIKLQVKEEKIDWFEKLSRAQTLALDEYKPMLIFFNGKDCPWSRKMDKEVFTDAAVKEAMKNFVPVRLDLDTNWSLANKYGVYQVPTILLISSDMSAIGRINAFVDAKRLAAYLNTLTSSSSNVKEQKVNVLVRRLNQGKMQEGDWEELLTAMGWGLAYRRQILDAVFAMKKFPIKKLTGFLTHKKLVVRTGAIEQLEEYQGDNFGYDPWFEGAPGVKDLEAIAKWKKLAADGKIKRQNTAVLTRERYDILLNKVLSPKREVSARAVFILKNGGNGALTATLDFLKKHPDLTAGHYLKMKELEYAIIFTQLGLERTLSLAHQLVYGNLDSKARALSYLSECGPQTMQVIKDYLDDPESILRETAVDALISAGNIRCVKYLEKHLEKEKNPDVIFCILKNLGKVKSIRSAELLVKYLKDPNEDLNIIALQSLTEIEAKKYGSKVISCLKNPHWRVQVAALEAISKMQLKCHKEIEKLLDSKDEFVRIKAVESIISQQNYQPGKKLQELYFKYDSMKGPVVGAYGSLNKALPDSFVEALKGKDVNVLSQVASNLRIRTGTGLNMAKFLLDNSNDDIAGAAAALISGAGEIPLEQRAPLLNKILESDSDKKILALVANISINDKEVNALQENNNTKPEKDEAVQELFDAFSEDNSKAKEEKIGTDDLLLAFGGKKTEKGSADAVQRFIKLLKDKLVRKNKQIAFYSALVLARLRQHEGIDYLASVFDSLTAEEKTRVFYCFQNSEIFNDKVKEMARKGFSDKNKEVAENAVELILNDKNKTAVEDLIALFKAFPEKKIYDYYGYWMDGKMRSRGMQDWAHSALQKKDLDDSLKIFALAVLGQRKSEKNRLLLLKFLNSKNLWVKRAAFYSYGRIDFAGFGRIAGKLSTDKNETIRAMVPILARRHFNYNYGTKDIVYFDSKHTIAIEANYYVDRKRTKLNEKLISILRKLTEDISPRVRFEAFLALMNADQDVDPGKLVKTLKKIQDKTVVSNAVSKYLGDNYLFMDKKFKVLLPYLNKNQFYGNKYEKIRQYFSGEKPGTVKTGARIEKLTIRSGAKTALQEKKPEKKSKSRKITLVFFHKPGCSDCKTVERYLNVIKQAYPEIVLQKQDLSTVAAMRLNESYCARFDVPSKDRLVAPAVFAASGYLIKDKINFDKLGRLIADANQVKDENWHVVEKQDIEKSDERIETRYKEIRTAIIFLAGLLDGINPCAFATIIFFISYMLIARKDKKEIMQVSIAFILGVFIAYYLMGLGITEFITRLAVVQILGIWFNRLIMAAALVMMILCIYDGILCLKGKLEDTALQLPGFLKERIRGSIREGSRKYHYISAAFVTGIIISFLELACTGQVYAPTIMFMLKTSQQSFQAYYLLFIYNLAFILPLIAIFILSYLGMKSATLTKIFKKNAAFVKFGTALLFLVIFVILLLH
jgi:cytochrome c biogenesis protein CcdA/HEAT repeat protein/glutaredoxin